MISQATLLCVRVFFEYFFFIKIFSSDYKYSKYKCNNNRYNSKYVTSLDTGKSSLKIRFRRSTQPSAGKGGRGFVLGWTTYKLPTKKTKRLKIPFGTLRRHTLALPNFGPFPTFGPRPTFGPFPDLGPIPTIGPLPTTCK